MENSFSFFDALRHEISWKLDEPISRSADRGEVHAAEAAHNFKEAQNINTHRNEQKRKQQSNNYAQLPIRTIVSTTSPAPTAR